MKPHKRILLGLLVCGAAAVLIAGASGRSRSNRQQASNSADPPRSKTLREIGQERDIEVPVGSENNEYDDLQSLAKSSVAIVLGRITEEKSSFESDNYISTYYTVNVERVLKDAASSFPASVIGDKPPQPVTSPLKFVRPGGVVYVNGHRVSEKLKGSELLTAGKRYVIFLIWSRAYQSYHLLGGSSGAFLVEDDLRIKTLGSWKQLRQKHDDLYLEVFINEVLSAPAL